MSVDKETKFADVKCSSEKEKVSFGAAVKQFFFAPVVTFIAKETCKGSGIYSTI
jgi:hypothetical protein